MPNFIHSFEPNIASPAGSVIDLTTREIEDAGLREVLQSRGAAVGPWGIFDALLDSTSTQFRFLEQLGQARETKTAISGLFGRFIARAYASRYLGLSHFAHVAYPPMKLAAPFGGEVQRVTGRRGDLPDWVAWGPGRGMAIVEAKGCHDAAGPGAALQRAYVQAERAEIQVGGRRAPFKRYAIATRWGFAAPLDWEPMISIRDPDEAGDDVPAEQIRELHAGVVRLSYANLLDRLHQHELATAMRQQVTVGTQGKRREVDIKALEALGRATQRQVEWARDIRPRDALVGGFVTRSGVLPTGELSAADQEVLRRLQMRPAFVGVEAQMLQVAITGDIEEMERQRFAGRLRERDEDRVGPADDGAGTWVVRLDEDEAIVQ